MNKFKRIFLIFCSVFSAVNLLVFLLFFIPNYVLEESTEIIEYSRIFITKFAEFAIPVVSATLLFGLLIERGTKSAVKGALVLALPRIIYLLPYYYLYHIAFGYDSIESILLSALVTVFGVAITFATILLLLLLARFLASKACMKPIAEKLPPKMQKDMTMETRTQLKKEAEKSMSTLGIPDTALDFSHPITLGIFSASFAGFCLNFLVEFFDTVTYLLDYAGYYRIEEIIYIVVCYLFLLAEFFVTNWIAHLIWKRICSERKIDE